jgi:hypothetical protein
MTVTTVTAQEGRASAAQSRLFDTFLAREVKLGSFTVHACATDSRETGTSDLSQ